MQTILHINSLALGSSIHWMRRATGFETQEEYMRDGSPLDYEALVGTHGTITAAANAVDLPYTTFYDRLKRNERPARQEDSPSRVLIIGDTHCPVMLDGYVDFLQKTYERYACDRVVHIGDVVDWAAISYHKTPLTESTPRQEYYAALEQVATLYEAFPTAQVTLGNHGALTIRRGEDVGIFPELMKDHATLWQTPGWEWLPRYADLEIDGVMYRHGDKALGGQQAAWKNAKVEFRSVVQGHHHSQLGAWYFANQNMRVFGLQTGCGVDSNSSAMSYGQVYAAKPLIGCGVVLEGQEAHAIPMDLGSRYH
jgi:hypothetical protein